MTNLLTRLNIAFIIEFLFVILIAVGIMPREGALFLAVFLPIVLLTVSLEESVFFIARSIPLFLALPITESFDNFNIWRIIISVIFLKLVIAQKQQIIASCKNIVDETKKSLFSGLKFVYSRYKFEFLIAVLFSISLFSLLESEDLGAGIKRVVYFVNLGLLFFIVRYAINHGNFMRLGRNFIFSSIIISMVGIIQLISAYLMPIGNFAEYWAFVIERNLYGNTWAQIAISANTWFAYFNSTIHLRMFSSFPDSHSFPLYLLIASIFVASFIAFQRSVAKTCKPAYVILGLFSLCLALSGTRGIWAAVIVPILIIIFYYFQKIQPKEVISKLSLPIIFFIVALIISQPIFNSKQFRLLENQIAQENILAGRLISIFNSEETSNQGRIQIWKESIKSIIKNPFLGVGIGNFPTVLKQDISMAKAGSSAHNLFLQILAEMGIFAFAIFLIIIYEIYKKAQTLSNDQNILVKFFGLLSILYIGWILTYTMTDPAIFDERVFLALMILIGTIFGLNKELQITKVKIRN